MTKKAKQYPNPRFSSLEEEDEYWKTHSPLDEGYEGEVQKSKRKRSSFLSIRLTGDELTQLRDMAAKFGMGPSTYARQVLRLTIEQEHLGMHYPSFPPPSFLFPPLYDSTDKHEIMLRCSQERTFGQSPDEFLERAEKAYAAYLEALKEALESRKTYMETEKKAHTPEDDAYKAVERTVKASK